MKQPSWGQGPPKHILLATDLSARCDRALDRAAALAEQWKAKLVVLHVLEEFPQEISDAVSIASWRRPRDPAAAVRSQLMHDIGAAAKKARVVVERGDPVDTILRVAEAQRCGLVVTGIARDELFGRFHLGRTTSQLLRRCKIPLLVVKDRARKPYRHIVVASDFSESSRHALDAAAAFFPTQTLTLFHAYDAPMSGLAASSEAVRRDYRKVAVRDCEAFLERAAKAGKRRKRPHVMIEYGAPDQLLREYVRDQEADLVVLGTHGRSAIFDVVIGSVAKKIMSALPCDALVIREPRAALGD